MRWLAGFCLAGALLLVFVDPTRAGLPPCPSRALAGLYCPGCGTLRAGHALLHGQAMQAVQFNPLFVLCLPLLGWLMLRYPRPLPSAFILSLAVLCALYALARNLPGAPPWLTPP